MTEKTLRDDLLKTNDELGLGLSDLIQNLTPLELSLTIDMIDDFRDRRGDDWLKSHSPVIRTQIEMMGEL